MSLINDLVIEVDRRRREERGRARTPLSGLAPVGLRRREDGRMPVTAVAYALLGVGTVALVFAAGRLLDGKAPAFPSTLDVAVAETPATPPVSAKRPAPPAIGPSQAVHESIVERRPSVRDASIDRGDDEIVLRFEIDGPAAYHAEASDGARRLELSIDAKSSPDLTEALDLAGTPIRRLRSLASAGETTMVFEFDEPETVHTRWSEDALGAVLELSFDLRREAWTRVERPAPTAIESDAWVEWPAIELPVADTVDVAPQAGDGPSDVSIERSASDRALRDHEARRARGDALVHEARLARSEGRAQEARLLYFAALDEAPDHRRALAELATLAIESGEASDVIERVRAERQRAPRDADLAMLHAKLVAATGRLEGAIQILDGSTLRLTEAPEVHALAAAYLQQAGAFELAIERYERLVRRYPGESRWWMGLGIAFESADRSSGALDVYRIAAQLGALPASSRRWVASRIESLVEEG